MRSPSYEKSDLARARSRYANAAEVVGRVEGWLPVFTALAEAARAGAPPADGSRSARLAAIQRELGRYVDFNRAIFRQRTSPVPKHTRPAERTRTSSQQRSVAWTSGHEVFGRSARYPGPSFPPLERTTQELAIAVDRYRRSLDARSTAEPKGARREDRVTQSIRQFVEVWRDLEQIQELNALRPILDEALVQRDNVRSASRSSGDSQVAALSRFMDSTVELWKQRVAFIQGEYFVMAALQSNEVPTIAERLMAEQRHAFAAIGAAMSEAGPRMPVAPPSDERSEVTEARSLDEMVADLAQVLAEGRAFVERRRSTMEALEQKAAEYLDTLPDGYQRAKAHLEMLEERFEPVGRGERRHGQSNGEAVLFLTGAHPDDELLHSAAAFWDATRVSIQLTDGAGGKQLHTRLDTPTSHANLSDERAVETEQAAAFLGFAVSYRLGIGDGGMPGYPTHHVFRVQDMNECEREALVDRVVEIMEEHAVTTVVTLQPYEEMANGGYNHPDHLALVELAEAATQRFNAIASIRNQDRATLLYTSLQPELIESLRSQFGHPDVPVRSLPERPVVRLPVAKEAEAYLEAAGAAYASQAPGFGKLHRHTSGRDSTVIPAPAEETPSRQWSLDEAATSLQPVSIGLI